MKIAIGLILKCVVASIFLMVMTACVEKTEESSGLVVSNVTLYPAPGESALEGVDLYIQDGKIVEIGKRIKAKSRYHIDGQGRAVTAGLWNSHVHFTLPGFAQAPEPLMRDMFLRYGFTYVLDTGSSLSDTLNISRRIQKGHLLGPTILTASGGFVYTDGTPSYLPDIKLPELSTPEQAEQVVVSVLDDGANGVKIFSGSFMSITETIHLPPDIIRAATSAVHEQGGFVVSHPTDAIGLRNAVENGVDVLAHTAPQAGPFGEKLIEAMKNNNIALIPTLKLWSYELNKNNVPKLFAQRVEDIAVLQLSEYHKAGGEILFGTDVGYMEDFDPSKEYALMVQAGMDFDSILRSLTTAPSLRFTNDEKRVVEGVDADLVIYSRDPRDNPENFANVAYTIKDGKVVYCVEQSDVCPVVK